MLQMGKTSLPCHRPIPEWVVGCPTRLDGASRVGGASRIVEPSLHTHLSGVISSQGTIPAGGGRSERTAGAISV